MSETNRRGGAFRRIALGAAAAVSAGALILGGGLAANADPTGAPTYRALAGVGSDTTQDVLNGVASQVSIAGGLAVGSYDATGGGTIQTKPLGSTFARPNGSSDGVRALSSAITETGKTWAGAAQPALEYNDVQFARSSSGPASPNATGALLYLPFATDAVTYATLDNTVIPSGITVGTTSPATPFLSTAPGPITLRNIYAGGGVGTGTSGTYLRSTINGTQYSFYVGNGTPVAGFTKLNVYVPQAGSGTRTFWATTVGISATSLPRGVTDIDAAGTGAGTPVQEHDGSALVGDARAIVPFSIAQFIAQTNSAALAGSYGVTVVDRRNGADLNSIGTVAPLTGTGTLNPAFPVTRTVYNVVEYEAINPAGSRFNPTLAEVFGAGGLAYDTAVIEDFGFAVNPLAGGNHLSTGSLRSNTL